MNSVRSLAILAALPIAAAAGGLYVEVGNPAANAEAKAMNALAVVRVAGCHRPEISEVAAKLVRMESGNPAHSALKVVKLSEAGMWAVVGPASTPAVLEIAVENPDFPNYRPHVLLRVAESGIQWSSLKRYLNSVPASDLRATLGS